MKNWKDNFKNGKEIVISTSSLLGEPTSIIVISLGVFDNKILIADCEMKTTIENLKSNPKICIISGYISIKGDVEIANEGEYFDICIKENLGTKYKPKNAIIVDIKKVFDLDKGKDLYIKK